MEYIIGINVCDSAPPPEKGRSKEDGLKIHNETFEISSKLRKAKLFSISLSNLSDK